MNRLIPAFLLAVGLSAHAQAPQGLQKATFAGGCFWCTEEAFEKVPGVLGAVSGYMGGKTAKPSYEEVSAGITGHTEVVQVTYDPAKVSYAALLDAFWVNHDPTMLDRQFCDRGSQYRPAIFTHGEEQKRLAEESKAQWQKKKPFAQPLLTPIVAATEFWPAEEGHQDYYKKNPVRYRYYVTGCGRYDRLDSLWGPLRKKK